MNMPTAFLIYLLSRPAVWWLRFLNIWASPLEKDFKAIL